jgi:DNA-binding SARP family transcriptional activator
MGARFLVLGPVSISDGGAVTALGVTKPTALLAALLLHPGPVVPTAFLRQALWGSGPPARAPQTLQTYVVRLRRQMSGFGLPGDAVQAVRGGYRMAAGVGTLDLVEFRALLAEAARQGTAESQLVIVRRALGMWREPLLGNVRSDALQRDAVPRLVEEWRAAQTRAFELELGLGRVRGVLAELGRVSGAHPGHEPFREQLVRALYRVGRRGEALAECRRSMSYLHDELGVNPGAPLRGLELAILRGEDVLPPAARIRRRGRESGPVLRTASFGQAS